MKNNAETPFHQFEQLQTLNEILEGAYEIGDNDIIAISLRKLILSGLPYTIEDGLLTCTVHHKSYQIDIDKVSVGYELECHGINLPFDTVRTAYQNIQKESHTDADEATRIRQKAEGRISAYEQTVRPNMVDAYAEEVEEEEPAKKEPVEEEPAVSAPVVHNLNKFMEKVREKEKDTPHKAAIPKPEKKSSGIDALLDELGLFDDEDEDESKEEESKVADVPPKDEVSVSFEKEDGTPVTIGDDGEEEEEEEVTKSEMMSDLDGLVSDAQSPISLLGDGFGRDSVSNKPVRRASSYVEEDTTEAKEEYPLPFQTDFKNTYHINVKKCVFSMILGEVYHENDNEKNDIYFMVAPFHVVENSPSTNLTMYAFYKGQNYALTSLNNKNRNSICCQVAEYQFLIRGKFKDGKWGCDVQLMGNSLKNNDVFVIKSQVHNTPEEPEDNGHIRFLYDGYINHKNVASKGCVDVFPMDANLAGFVIVRCIEDFIDIFFTDDVEYVELKTTEGLKRMHLEVSEKRDIDAVIEDYVEETKGEYSVE
jgi:hypothetical protein